MSRTSKNHNILEHSYYIMVKPSLSKNTLDINEVKIMEFYTKHNKVLNTKYIYKTM